MMNQTDPFAQINPFAKLPTFGFQQMPPDYERARSLFPVTTARVRQGPLATSLASLSGQLAANPYSFGDAAKRSMITAESDAASSGYNKAREGLRRALASAGALDSPVGLARENQLQSGLAANLQGIRARAEATQQQTRLQDLLRAIQTMSGLQSQQAQQEYAGAAGELGALKAFPWGS